MRGRDHVPQGEESVGEGLVGGEGWVGGVVVGGELGVWGGRESLVRTLDERGEGGGKGSTGVGVEVVVFIFGFWARLFLREVVVFDFFELDHFELWEDVGAATLVG